MRYHFFVTVWAAPFVEKFLRYSLPTILSANNLPALTLQADVSFHIFTDRASVDTFRPAINELENTCTVDWRLFEDVAYGDARLSDAIENSDPSIVKHNVQRVTAQQVMALASVDEEAAVLLDSDFILADGAFQHMHDLRVAGNRGLASMFMRLSQEVAAPQLDDMMAGWLPGWSGIEARDLVSLGLRAMHPIARAYFVDAPSFTRYPTQLNWPVGGQGFVTHCFFPHPVMVMPGPRSAKYFSTMDYEAALRCVEQDEDIHLARSSDDFLVCKMTPPDYLADTSSGAPPSIDLMAQFAINNTNLRHRYFMDQPIRFVANGDGSAFDQVEAETCRFVEAIYKAVELSLGRLSADDAKTLVYLKSFLGPIENFMSPQVHARIKDWLPDKE